MSTATINQQADRRDTDFADRKKVFFAIFDNNQATAALQDGKFPLDRLDEARNHVVTCRNVTGNARIYGAMVRIQGEDSGKPTFIDANHTTGVFANGFVMESTLPNSTNGNICRKGVIEGVDTSIGGFVEGGPVYLSNNAYIGTKPTTGVVQRVGTCITVAFNGKILFDPESPSNADVIIEDFKSDTPYEKYSTIVRNMLLYRAKAGFTSSSTWDPNDWEQISEGSPNVANIVDYGAVSGDPGTDLRPIIDAIIADGKKIIFIPNGVWYWNTGGNFTADDITIIGESDLAILQFNYPLTGPSDQDNMWDLSNCNRWLFKNVHFRGYNFVSPGTVNTQSSNGHVMIRCGGCTFIHIRECLFTYQINNVVRFDNAWDVEYTHNVHRQSPVDPTDQDGANVHLGGTLGNAIISNNFFLDAMKNSLFFRSLGTRNATHQVCNNLSVQCDNDTGIPVPSWKQQKLHGFTIQYGTISEIDQSRLGNRMVFTGNMSYGARWSNLYLMSDNQSPQNDLTHAGCRAEITGNVFASGGLAVDGGDSTLQGAVVIAAGREVNFTGNLILDYVGTEGNNSEPGGHAIRLGPNNTGLQCRIANNIIANCGGAGVYGHKWLDGVIVENNAFVQRQDAKYEVIGAAGYTVDDANDPYGIYLNPDVTGRTVTIPADCKERRLVNLGSTSGAGEIINITSPSGTSTLYPGEALIVQWNTDDNQLHTMRSARASWNVNSGSLGSLYRCINFSSSNSGPLRGPKVKNNYIETDMNGGILMNSLSNTTVNDTNAREYCQGNIVINIGRSIGFTSYWGDGIAVYGDVCSVTDNHVFGWNQGIFFPTVTQRLTNGQKIFRNNHMEDCSYGVRADGASGLLPMIGCTFKDMGNHPIRNFGTTTAIREVLGIHNQGQIVMTYDGKPADGLPYLDGDIALNVSPTAAATDPTTYVLRSLAWVGANI